MDTIGTRLTYARKQRGYTQEALAEEIGVSRGVIFNLEKNKTEPQAIVLNAVCQSLGLKRQWLLTGEGQMEDGCAAKSAKILAELYEVAKELSEEEQLYILDTIKSLKLHLGRK